ncbi:hypothetical protein Tco_0743226 [Tanacetum coccineum]
MDESHISAHYIGKLLPKRKVIVAISIPISFLPLFQQAISTVTNPGRFCGQKTFLDIRIDGLRWRVRKNGEEVALCGEEADFDDYPKDDGVLYGALDGLGDCGLVMGDGVFSDA